MPQGINLLHITFNQLPVNFHFSGFINEINLFMSDLLSLFTFFETGFSLEAEVTELLLIIRGL